MADIKSPSQTHQGLQSFRSMRRMEASFKKARPLLLRFSQSLAGRRQRLSRAIVRSTIQRLGSCTNPDARSDRVGKNWTLIGGVGKQLLEEWELAKSGSRLI
jgi:hypothetical protein